MNEGKCKETVFDHDSRWPRSYQCHNKTVTPEGYCRIHDPAYIKKKSDEREAKYQASKCKCGFSFSGSDREYFRYCPICGKQTASGMKNRTKKPMIVSLSCVVGCMN